MRRPLCLGLLAFALTLLANPTGSLLFAAEESGAIGQVTELRGQVETRRNGVLQSLTLGAEVSEGDLLRTGPGAYVKVAHEDGSWVFVGADSAVVFSQRLLDPDGVGRKGILTLVIGILRTKLFGSPWRDSFEVKTRAAVAAARSTEWIVESRPLNTAVLVVEGEVAVTAKGAPDRVLLGPGMGTDVPLDGVLSPPAVWGEKRVADVKARTSPR
ncbi:MAG TPA: FecR family protein [Kiloniellaceae bacterium]|nr:FecR family protein [Kiloniellaceae bacterium]